MDAPVLSTPALHRTRCAIHALRRAEQRGVDLGPADIAAIEAAIRALAVAWVGGPGVGGDPNRYWFRARHGNTRCRVLWDARLDCIVTVVEAGAPR
jgi:hypothetical protein